MEGFFTLHSCDSSNADVSLVRVVCAQYNSYDSNLQTGQYSAILRVQEFIFEAHISSMC